MDAKNVFLDCLVFINKILYYVWIDVLLDIVPMLITIVNNVVLAVKLVIKI